MPATCFAYISSTASSFTLPPSSPYFFSIAPIFPLNAFQPFSFDASSDLPDTFSASAIASMTSCEIPSYAVFDTSSSASTDDTNFFTSFPASDIAYAISALTIASYSGIPTFFFSFSTSVAYALTAAASPSSGTSIFDSPFISSLYWRCCLLNASSTTSPSFAAALDDTELPKHSIQEFPISCCAPTDAHDATATRPTPPRVSTCLNEFKLMIEIPTDSRLR
mmetsp:Transcript_1017/g.3093  ORF Transcript_1017/g.3093 Transcript_1017/m.3093 type:complete len:222 (+) Transcript_1017:373-1038(+)